MENDTTSHSLSETSIHYTKDRNGGTPDSNREDYAAFEKLGQGGKEMQSAYTFLYTKYKPKLKYYFIRASVSNETAEDIIQTTFLKFFKSYSSFKKKSKLSTYLFTIARNVLVDHIRKNPSVDELPDNIDSNNLIPDFSALEQCVYSAFQDFKQDNFDCAQNLMLSVYNNLKGEDLAKILGKSLGAVHEYLSQCRKKLMPYLVKCNEHL